MKPNGCKIPKPPPRVLKNFHRLRPTLAIVLGSGFHHVLTGLRAEKSPLHGGIAGLKLCHEHGSRNRNGHPKTEAAGDS